MAVAGGNGPLTPHIMRHQIDGQQPPKQADMFFGGVEG